MKKSELIAKLLAIPGDPEVAVVDHLKNIFFDDGDGTTCGIYQELGVELITTEGLPADHPAVVDGMMPYIALSFKNEEYEEDGDDEGNMDEDETEVNS